MSDEPMDIEKRATVRTGWNIPKPEIIPKPSVWPPAMALAIMLVAWGIITSVVLLGVGLLLFAVSLAGWIGDIRNER